MTPTAPDVFPRHGHGAPCATTTRESRGLRLVRGTWRRLGLALAAALVAGCGGGGTDEALKVAVSAHGRVALGALGGAAVQVYRVGDYGTPVATATTSTGGSPAEIGRFSVSLPSSPPGAMFLLVATGGSAYDADEDGSLDATPTPNQGAVHALATAAELNAQEVLLSAVTEVVYQRVRYFLEALYDEAYVSRACDAWASFVLRTSVDLRVAAAGAGGDPSVGNRDALAFDPRLTPEATYLPYAAHFADVVGTVLAGEPVTERALYLSREEIHFEALPGECDGVALAGNVAYVCRGAGGLETWDVLDPTDPHRLATFDTSGVAREVQVVGTLAYVAAGAGGLRIVDVADPAQPTLLTGVALSSPVASLHVVANRAYLCSDAGTPKLHVVDVTDPAHPAVLSETPVAAAASTVRVEGNFAYVLEGRQVETVDVTDPIVPVSQGAFATGDNAHIDVAPGHLYVADSARFEAFSLATPASPQSIASIPVQGASSYGLRVRGTRALLTRGLDGLALVDVSDPAQPSYLGVVPTSGTAFDAALDGGLCVVSARYGGVSTVAAGTPAPSGVVASVPWENGVYAVKAAGNLVYATTNRPTELVVFDASNPLALVQAGSAPLPGGFGTDLAVRDGHAFVTDYGGLSVFDATNPAAPTLEAGDATLTKLQGVAVAGGVAYATVEDALAVYDASDPAATKYVGYVPVSGTGQKVACDGSVLAVAAGPRFYLYDATTPTAPVTAASLPLSFAVDVVLRPPFAFVAQYDGGGINQVLRVVDCSVLAAPAVVRTVRLPGMVDRLARSGDLVYASASVAGVNVVDVAQPSAAHQVGTIPVPANIYDLDVGGGYVYVADGFPNGALRVLRAAQVAVP